MAAYNFPNSPSDGDTVTSNGITYTYSSSKTRWDAAAASGSSTTVYATIDLLPLSGASTGDQAYVSGNNRLYIWNGTGWYNIALINTTPSISGVSSSYGLAVDGTATTVTITATDPEGIPITYSIASDTSGNIATVSQGTGSNTNVFTITPTTNTANGGTFSLTFRASDGVNIATAVSEFTLVFGIPNSQFTTALVTSVGANNAVNNSFDDASTNNHTITANGNVTQNTFSPHRHGGYSTYFDGNDRLSLPQTSLNLGSNDFCVEAWVYTTATSQQAIAGSLVFSNGTGAWLLTVNYNSKKIRFFMRYGGGSIQDAQFEAGTFPTNQWVHVAVTRDGANLRAFINGTQAGTTNTVLGSSAIDNALTNYFIGDNLDGNTYWNGYITDFRVVGGNAVYTSAFTPPDERLSAITGTKLLACHLPYIADGSTNAHSITVNGDTKTEPFSPYGHSGYTSGSNSGSMYFDGSGDYITIADDDSLDMESSDFTIEGWYYPIDNPGGAADGLFTKRANGSAANGVGVYFASSDATPSILLEASGGGTWSINSAASIAFNIGMWNHFALVRNGTSLKLYINGAEGFSTTMYAGAIPANTASFTLGALGADGSYPLSKGIISEFRVVKGTAVYTANFTPPTAPLTAISGTSLLLKGTDAAIIDKSQSVKTITLDGNVKSSTAQTKYLSSSMYFDGEGDYVRIDGNETLSSYAGDFTIEMWVYPTGAGPVSGAYLYHQAASATSYSPILIVQSAGSYNFTAYASSTLSGWDLASAVSIGSGTQNSWHHIAVVREGTNLKTFLNGTLGTTTSVGTTSLGSATTTYTRLGGGNYANTDFTGYMSDVRITKGLARYTSNFTPPSAALEG